MALTVYNPQKGRLETIDVKITQDNTTWFDNCVDDQNIYMITDFKSGLIISEFGYSYPIRIYDSSRTEIGNSQKKASEMSRSHE